MIPLGRAGNHLLSNAASIFSHSHTFARHGLRVPLRSVLKTVV